MTLSSKEVKIIKQLFHMIFFTRVLIAHEEFLV